MRTIVSKTVVSILAGILYIVFVSSDVLRRVPGFYCEGFGCVGLGFAYFLIGVLILPVLIGGLGFMTNKDSRIKHAFVSFGIALVVMIVSLFVLGLLNKWKVAVDTKAAKRTEALFWDKVMPELEADRNVDEKEGPLLIKSVNESRNDSGRGVFQAKIIPDEILINTPTDVTVSAEIGSVRDVQSVVLREAGSAISSPMAMHDDGKNGDMRANDTVFSVQNKMLISEAGERWYRIEVVYTDGYLATSHMGLKLSSYKPLDSLSK